MKRFRSEGWRKGDTRAALRGHGKRATTMTWLIMSPSGVLHAVRSEKLMRDLCTDNGLSYDKLAKHIGLKPTDRGRPRPKHVQGWRELCQSQWLQSGQTIVCVAGANAAEFIKLVNSSVHHPCHGAFNDNDAERLAHLFRSGWVWSNNQKVRHMHGWKLLEETPANPEQLVVTMNLGSAYAPDVPPMQTTAPCDGSRSGSRHDQVDCRTVPAPRAPGAATCKKPDSKPSKGRRERSKTRWLPVRTQAGGNGSDAPCDGSRSGSRHDQVGCRTVPAPCGPGAATCKKTDSKPSRGRRERSKTQCAPAPPARTAPGGARGRVHRPRTAAVSLCERPLPILMVCPSARAGVSASRFSG